jgi:hypothetical protein
LQLPRPEIEPSGGAVGIRQNHDRRVGDLVAGSVDRVPARADTSQCRDVATKRHSWGRRWTLGCRELRSNHRGRARPIAHGNPPSSCAQPPPGTRARLIARHELRVGRGVGERGEIVGHPRFVPGVIRDLQHAARRAGRVRVIGIDRATARMRIQKAGARDARQ